MRRAIFCTILLVHGFHPRHSASAQGRSLNADTTAGVVAALAYAHHDLLQPGKRYLFSLAQTDRSKLQWSDTQARSLTAALAARTPGTSVHVCGGESAPCLVDARTEVISIAEPVRLGDSLVVEIEVRRSTGVQRIPVALRGDRYVLVRRNGVWVVVSSEMVSVS